MADSTQRAERDDDCDSASAERAARCRAGSPATSAMVRNGNTVLTFADRSTMTIVGVTRLDQLRLFSSRQLRAVWRLI